MTTPGLALGAVQSGSDAKLEFGFDVVDENAAKDTPPTVARTSARTQDEGAMRRTVIV